MSLHHANAHTKLHTKNIRVKLVSTNVRHVGILPSAGFEQVTYSLDVHFC